MKIRHLTKADKTAAMKLSSLCFDYPYDTNGKTEEEYFEYLINHPQEKLHAHPEYEVGAFTDDGELMAATAAIPFTFYFDGSTYSGNGIGNVSTYPQHRRKGAIRAIFMNILKESYESGQTFSYLYPFSEAFYGAFGYRRTDNSILHTYSLQVLPDYRSTGSFSIKQGSEVPEDYKTAYFAFAKKFNMMVKRDDLDWKNLTEAKGSENNNYAYLYRDADGV
ncbi:MAG: GNAT family N-acetyltransferase, partial [Lachnospiraceae bacterium]